MIKERQPLSMYETLKVLDEIKETDKSKDLKTFIKKFAETTPAKAKKLMEDLESLKIIKLKNSDIVKIIDIMPENAVELNKIFTEVSLDSDETNKILESIKNNK
jgi:DNA-directed RNA polymerase subunit F